MSSQMSSPKPSPNGTPGIGASLSTGLTAGTLVGVMAGLFDGLVRTLGIDPGLFVIRWQQHGPWHALTQGWPEFVDLPGLLGCTAAAALLYGGVAALLSLLFAGLAHPLLRGLDRQSRFTRQLGPWLGTWFFFELYWWSRPLVLPGLPATNVKRLAVAALMLIGCLGLGLLATRLRRRVPAGCKRRAPVVLGLVALLGGGYLWVDRGASAQDLGQVNERNRDLPNVLIFVVDALRQDVLGCYGNQEVKTPNIDALAAEGVLFEDAFVQAPFTWTSFGSFLTGKYPRRHGLVLMAPGFSLPPNLTLPEYLHGAPRADGKPFEGEDMVGAAFLTGTLSHGSGLARGFDYYFETIVGHELVDVHSRWSQFRSGLLPWLYKNKLHQKVNSSLVATTAAEWFREHGDRRFVSLVHYYSTHTPYDPPAEYRELYCDPDYDGPFPAFYASHRVAIEDGSYEPTEADVAQIRNLYYAGVTQADAMIGTVLDELRDEGVLDNTIVVVTSDHGESLGEHGLWEHNFMYQDNLRIPLVMRWPAGLPQGKSVAGIVDSIDLVPTLTELMGLASLTHADELAPDASHSSRMDAIDGVSLLPRIRGDVDHVRRFSYAENGRYLSIQDESWKLIVRREQVSAEGWQAMLDASGGDAAEPELERPRFFDLKADPLELNDLYGSELEEHRQKVEALAVLLRVWSASMPIRDDLLRSSHRDMEAEANALDALGYSGDGVGDMDAVHGGKSEDGEDE
jgi:arylsulfatase A-like enzyme